MSIEKRDFPLSRRGYDSAAVDAHLRELADRFEAERSRPQSLASAAGEQVQSIVAAAESSAADIRRDAEVAARATAEAVTSDAERVRAEATRQAQEYVATMRDATSAMVERVQALEAELEALVGSVRSNGEPSAPRATSTDASTTPHPQAGEGHAIAQRRRPTPEGVTGLVLLTAVVVAPAAAHADAVVRLAHAVPGAGAAELEVQHAGTSEPAGEARFGEVSARHALAAGAVKLRLVAREGERVLASGSLRLRDGGRYTVVAQLSGGHVKLKAYTDGRARPGVVRLRVIHAAPELGSPDLMVDGKTVTRGLRYRAATPYLSLEPGTHHYSARSPGADVMLSGGLDLRPARAYTGLVVGSRGARVRVVLAVDDTATGGGARSAPGERTSSGQASYVVRPGDSLWAIAQQGLGAGTSDAAVARRVVHIWNVNKQRIGTGDPDLIYTGTRLRLF